MIIGSGKRDDGRSVNFCKCDACGDDFVRRSDGRQFSTCAKCVDIQSGMKRSTHRESTKNSKIYTVWQNMRRRCETSSNPRFKHYGGRGISVCDEWHDYEKFRDWCKSNGWNEFLTIDRIDVDSDYTPDNCRFVDKSVQNANRGVIKTNTSKFVGVWYEKGAFCSRVTFRGEIINIGRFGSLSEAVIARDSEIDKRGWPNKKSGIELMSYAEIAKIEIYNIEKSHRNNLNSNQKS